VIFENKLGVMDAFYLFFSLSFCPQLFGFEILTKNCETLAKIS
jgi:hypothetical protein